VTVVPILKGSRPRDPEHERFPVYFDGDLLGCSMFMRDESASAIPDMISRDTRKIAGS
jgi:hypothetical protein